EELETKIKDITLEVYTSKIRRFLIEQDIWHGPNYDAQIADLQDSNDVKIKKSFQDFVVLQPYLRYRKQIELKKKAALGNALTPFEEKLRDLALVPRDLLGFNVIFFANEGENLRDRIRLWRKQRTVQRLREELIEIKDPTAFM